MNFRIKFLINLIFIFQIIWNVLPEFHSSKTVGNLIITVIIKRIDIRLDCTCKQSRILRYHRYIVSNIMQTYGTNIFLIQYDGTFSAILILCYLKYSQ